MCMKQIVLCILFLLVGSSAFATGQESDVLFYHGLRWMLLARPADSDSSLSVALEENLPSDRCKSTANWGGYVGYWSVRGDMLILHSIKVQYLQNGDCVDATLPDSFIRRVFHAYDENGVIVARWYSGTLRLARGEMLRYEHVGWERNYETEIVLTVQNGRIVDSVEYHNRVVCEGFDFESLSMQGWDSLQLGFRPVLQKYPQLEGKERIIFIVSDFIVDSHGKLVDILRVRCYTQMDEELNHKLEQEFKQYLMNIRPWKVLYINGEYCLPFWRGWSIPIRLNSYQK